MTFKECSAEALRRLGFSEAEIASMHAAADANAQSVQTLASNVTVPPGSEEA